MAARKGGNDRFRFCGGGLLAGEAEDIRVIVLAGSGGVISVAAGGGANAEKFIRGDSDPDTRGAEEDAEVGLSGSEF